MEIYIYGVVGRDVIFQDVKKAIDLANGEPIHLRISSEGGDVYEGYRIYQELNNYKGIVTAYIDGYCMSIATLIALAASEVTISPIGTYLIHNPMASPMMADAKELITTAKQLINIEDFLIGKYASKTLMSRDEVEKIMNEGREMTAQEAVDYGFVDRRGEPLKAVAYVNKTNEINMANEQLKNAFLTIMNALEDKAKVSNEAVVEESKAEVVEEKPQSDLEKKISELEAELTAKAENEKTLEAQLEEMKAKEAEVVAIKEELSKLQNTILGEAPVAAVENRVSNGSQEEGLANWFNQTLIERGIK